MYFVAVGVVLKAWTHVLQLASIDVNLCVVFGCSPIIIILVAFCCMYWVVNAIRGSTFGVRTGRSHVGVWFGSCGVSFLPSCCVYWEIVRPKWL